MDLEPDSKTGSKRPTAILSGAGGTEVVVLNAADQF